jgi:hypothetical protein
MQLKEDFLLLASDICSRLQALGDPEKAHVLQRSLRPARVNTEKVICLSGSVFPKYGSWPGSTSRFPFRKPSTCSTHPFMKHDSLPCCS